MNVNVDTAAREIVLARLKNIESKHAVRIVYACESGSRAWGFPSADSDYDVRFLYLRPTNWYLSILRGRDVIEEPIVDDFDVSGWDVQKALGLLYKSNPPLLEWLGSPIRYIESTAIAQNLRDILPDFYSAANCFAHYHHMADGNLREYLRGDVVRTKKYFYVLRPVLAMQWIEQGLGVVPTDFNVLVDHLVKDEKLLDDIQTLLREKRSGVEMQSGPRIESISSFLEFELERLSQVVRPTSERAPMERLDALFQESLKICWGS